MKKFKKWIWQRLSEVLGLSFRLSSGHSVLIRSYADWCVYGDLFANGEYDPAIFAALSSFSDRSIHVLDLGANNGFFALRLAHLATNAGISPASVHCLCVEACPSTFGDLSNRLRSLQEKGFIMDSCNCAAGDLTGEVFVSEARASTSNFIDRQRGRWKVPFRDFNDYPSHDEQLDLLKCDIEGAESSFLVNHLPLLERTSCCVLECHPPHYTIEQATQLMQTVGLHFKGILRSTNEGVTAWFQRL